MIGVLELDMVKNAFDIKKGRYRAAIGFQDNVNERNVELISYQYIV